jgi:hypothetical protein
MPVERSQILQFVKANYLFKKADDAALDFLARKMQSTELLPGEIIYDQGDAAANLYFVFNGNVRITQFKNEVEETMGILAEGDIFGYEMLEYDSICLSRATADSPATLLWMDREVTRQVLESVSTFNLDLKLLFESYLLSLNTRFGWCNPEESIHYVARRHIFFLLKRFIPILLFALITLPIIIFTAGKFSGFSTPIIFTFVVSIVILLWSLWSYVDWSNDYAVITNQRVAFVDKVILLYDSREEAPLNTILSVSTDTDFWGRTFGFGDVIARTYAGEIKLDHIGLPRQVSFLLTAKWDQAKSQLTQNEQAELEEAIRIRLGYKRESKTEPIGIDEMVSEVKRDSLQDRLLKPFRLRIVKNDVVIWRTHWLILVKKLLLPTLIFLASITLIILRLIKTISFISMPAFLGLAFLLLLVSGLWWLYNFLDWSNDIYIATPDQVIDVNHKPLGKEDRKAASLKNIQSVEFERLGIIGLLFDFGTVYINVGETTLTFDEVYNPAEVQRELFQRLAMYDQHEKRSQIEADQKRMADWIAAYHKVSREETKP